MKRFINSLWVCLLVLVCNVSAETKQEAVKVLDKDYTACFADWDKNLHSLQTDFSQTTEYDGVLISQSSGQLAYWQEKSWLRLDNTQENQITQTALTDKKTIWILDEKGKEVSTLSWQDWLLGQPNQALFDFGNYASLIKKHDSTVFEHKKDWVLLRLTPKNKQDNYTLYVVLGKEDCFPKSITIQSDLMKTTAELLQQRRNQDLPKNLFKGMK